MRIVILTSNRKGTASYCLPILMEQSSVEIVQVIYSTGVKTNKKKYFRQKFRKMARIGLAGAINGIRIRKWFSVEAVDGKPSEDLELICKRNNIPYAVTPAINSHETASIMQSCHPELGLSLGNSYIPAKIFSIPDRGMLNIHGEVLPDFQNAQSVIWQIYEGKAETGYTIHKIDKKIDTGEIIKQEKFPILFRSTLKDTVSASCAEILRRAANGLADVVSHFEDYDLHKRPQGQGRSYTTPSFGQFLRIYRNYKKLRGKL
jgi:methionyl-tRNA formyltransferase